MKFTNLEDFKLNTKNGLNQRLTENRENNYMTIDDVVNLLCNDLYEKKKKREQEPYNFKQGSQRFNGRHMKILKIEFSKSSIERDYKVVDDLA